MYYYLFNHINNKEDSFNILKFQSHVYKNKWRKYLNDYTCKME